MLPVSAAEVEGASASVPTMLLLTLARKILALRFVIPAHAPVSLNFTGMGLPNLKIELPSALIGWSTPDHEKSAPVQTPAWHVSVCVQALLSLHKVPFALAGFEH